MQGIQEAQVCKIDNNIKRIISIVPNKKVRDYLRSIRQDNCIKSYKIQRNGLFFNFW